MNKVKKAVGYVCEVECNGAVVSRETQLANLKKFAASENVELVAVFEDAAFTPDFAERPGVKNMLKSVAGVDAVLVDRVWCFSRKMSELRPFLAEVEAGNAQVLAATCLWDCVSQQVRRRYMEPLAEKQKAAARAKAAARMLRQAAA